MFYWRFGFLKTLQSVYNKITYCCIKTRMQKAYKTDRKRGLYAQENKPDDNLKHITL